MLKQPLLARMFKSRKADAAPVEDKNLAVSCEGKTALLEAKAAEDVSDTQMSSDEKALDPQTSSDTKGLDAKKMVADAVVSDTVEIVAGPKAVPADIVDKSTDDVAATKPAEKVVAPTLPLVSQSPKKARKTKLPKVTTTRAAIALGVLAVAAGAVVPRVVSPAARAIMTASMSDTLAGPTAPVSSPGDSAAESVVTTGNLFVTNQILYRKLEAIAGVTITDPKDRIAPTLPTPSSAPAADAGNPAAAADQPKDGKPSTAAAATAAAGDDQKTEGDPEAKKAAKPDPDVNVTAVAPPAPSSDPVVFTGTTIDSVLEMRVAVAKDVSGIGFATSSSGLITDLDGNTLKTLSPETGVLAEDADGLVVDGETMPSAFWVYPEDGGYVAIGDSWYRGRMLIAQRERGLIAVNYVLLGDYLYSVVGSEMSPNWAIESLKAQAIAARSYALTHNIHPASEEYFDLDNTQRFQAYKGIGREANTTQAAVQATAGEFISHEGGIVESLYAASQAIVDDAHKGSGMSQLGAKDLAEQGYSYQEILVHYYPGTALGRLETDQE